LRWQRFIERLQRLLKRHRLRSSRLLRAEKRFHIDQFWLLPGQRFVPQSIERSLNLGLHSLQVLNRPFLLANLYRVNGLVHLVHYLLLLYGELLELEDQILGQPDVAELQLLQKVLLWLDQAGTIHDGVTVERLKGLLLYHCGQGFFDDRDVV